MKSKTVRTLLAAAVVTVASASITGCYYYDHDHWRSGYYGDRYRYGYYDRDYRRDRDDYWWRYGRAYDRDDYWRYSRFNRGNHDHDND